MKACTALEEWLHTINEYMSHLSKPQAQVLALWSFGIVMTHTCGLTSVAAFLGELLGQREGNLRQRLREWYREAGAKKGNKRQTLDVTTCFAPLLRWVLSWWPAEEKRLALAMDASALGECFVVLAISVVYRSCAIPVAWVVLRANEPGAWQPHWLALFNHLKAAVPADWTVIVLADRGLYARWLFRRIQKRGWHPFLRINLGGKFRLVDAGQFRDLATVVPQRGMLWSGRVVCFKSKPLPCTLLACWDTAHAGPWLVVTDLAPEQAEVGWYGLRTWIECGFKDMKRGGLQWQYTRMTDPERATRFWLALAVATLWAVSVGGAADANLPAATFEALPQTHIARRKAKCCKPPRKLSCFWRGIIVILATALSQTPVTQGRFYPEPWPSTLEIMNMHVARDKVSLA